MIPHPNAAPKGPAKPFLGDEKPPLSSCPPGTVISGLNFLKGQPPVLAMADEDYPAWLWGLLKPKTNDGVPGGEGEKRRLRKQNRQHLRDKNKFGAL